MPAVKLECAQLDGYRLIARRLGDCVVLRTRGGLTGLIDIRAWRVMRGFRSPTSEAREAPSRPRARASVR